jgi:hypothetical protein
VGEASNDKSQFSVGSGFWFALTMMLVPKVLNSVLGITYGASASATVCVFGGLFWWFNERNKTGRSLALWSAKVGAVAVLSYFVWNWGRH